MRKRTDMQKESQVTIMKKYAGHVLKVAICGAVMAGLVAMPLLLTGCGAFGEKIYTSGIFAMDTIMEIEVAGTEDLTPVAEEAIRNIEKELSVTDPESQIARLNSQGQAEISADVADVLTRALDVCKRTDGDLDITIYPVLKAWGFTTGDYRVPDEEELQELLKNVDYSRVEVSTPKEVPDKAAAMEGWEAVLPEGFQVDLGSVAKGYTGCFVADKLRSMGVTHALLNLGGNVQCIGTKPNGEKWQVAVKSPFEDSTTGMLGVIAADDVTIITSGGYERYFEQDGETYWHILDPGTGKPVRSGLASVTIVGKDGLVCDALSTALFIKGLDKSVEFWKKSDDFEAVFVTETGEVYVTEGIAGDFKLTSEYRDAPLQIIRR